MRERLLATGLTERISPTSVTRPVNTLHPLKCFKRIGADGIDALEGMPLGALTEGLQSHGTERLGADTLEIFERT